MVHGYGGWQVDEMLGLAVRATELGLASFAIDLRGHGANSTLFDADLVADVETAVVHARRCGRVAAIGHSLGGRLALVSSADFALAISPAIASSYGPRTRAILGSTPGSPRSPEPHGRRLCRSRRAPDVRPALGATRHGPLWIAISPKSPRPAAR